jgi:poly(hydroxyalkanoate) depolymerase family esterase
VKERQPTTVGQLLRLLREGRWSDAASALGRVLKRRRRGVPADPAPPPDNTAFAPPGIDIETRVAATPPQLGPPAELPGAPAEFLDGVYTNEAGQRPYMLFLPSGHFAGPRPLLVMLHGCRQHPADFATGTRMNELAQAQGIVVLYPWQLTQANHLSCWNWFRPEQQQRGRGEPAIIAGLTRQVMDTHNIDPRRVYVAGLSAGGAMAAVVAATYPDLYAAVGVHSGLPHAAAHNLATAMSAMRHGPAARGAGRRPPDRMPLPTIVFHGDEDDTVHPDNGDEVIAQARWDVEATADVQQGNGMQVAREEVPGGRAYTRTRHLDRQGRCDAEHWLVHGSGHAWAGGSAQGTFTDPLGPDASAQMLRFFLEHPKEKTPAP